MLVAVVASLFAAALFSVASALQHRSAGLVTDADTERTAELTGFISKTLRDPLWIVGSVADVGGVALHAVALRSGPLTLVQPLLVTGVIFALALRQLLERRAPRPEEIALAAVLALGLVIFLVVATPANGVSQPADPAPTIVAATVIALGIFGFSLAGRRTSGGPAAVLLGAAAGLAFAGAAGLLKEVMGTLNHGVEAVATGWSFYALIAVGVTGLVVNQLAYQAGPLSSSLPVITTVDPIVSLVIGVAVFDEQFRNGPVDLLGEAVGLALVVAAAVGLTRSDPGPSHPQVPGATPHLTE